MRQQNVNFHQLSSLLRSLWPKKTPRFAMFGPGLESETSGLTRKIIEHNTGIFKNKGMFPGQFGGMYILLFSFYILFILFLKLHSLKFVEEMTAAIIYAIVICTSDNQKNGNPIEITFGIIEWSP